MFIKNKGILKFIIVLLLVNMFLITSLSPALASPDYAVTINPMITQTYSNWCWAAASTSILNISGYLSLTQSSFANTVQGNSNNNTRAINTVSSDFSTHYSVSTTYSSGTLSFSSIQGKVTANKPIYSHVDWSGGGAHHVVISGYDISGQTLRIMDPGQNLGGAWQYVTRSDFVSGNYRGSGTWSYYFYVN